MNLPNWLTTARLLLIPVFLLAASLKHAHSDYIAAAVFGLGAVTDGLDGYLARKKNQVTLLGKFLDPLADKILVSAALITLVELGRLPGWVAVLIISREFAVTGLRAIAAAQGLVIPASRLGKVKTVTQIVAIIAMFIGDFPFNYVGFPFGKLVMALAVLFTAWSGVDYFKKFWKLLKSDCC